MRPAKILTLLGLLIMAGAIVYGFATTKEGDIDLLFSLAWGRVSLIDLYVGFLVFAGWIVYREKSWGRIAVWIVLLLILGNLASCLYVLLTLQESQGRWNRFWLGYRAPDIQ